MAKNVGKLASRYAKALLKAVNAELGSVGSPTPAQHIARALTEFADVWEQQREFSGSMLNPMFEKSQRLSALLSIAENAGVPDIARRFLRVVFERDRIAALPEIAQAFAVQADASAGVLKVEVIVAKDIDSEEARTIEGLLAQQIQGSLEFQWSSDPALIGGMIVKYDGKVLDGSLSGRIGRIERSLLGGA